MRSLHALLRLSRNCIDWLGVRWRLFDLLVLRRDPLHADLPQLVIAERQLRP